MQSIQVMAAVQETIDQNRCGLAILISNGYKDTSNPLPCTIKDAESMKAAFAYLGFATHTEQDLGAARMYALTEEAAKCTYPDSYKCIAFTFSGHGHDANHIISDDRPMRLVETEKLINSFLPDKAPNIGKIPKLFFIDACRGGEDMEDVFIPKSFLKSNKMNVPPKGHFLVAYSNMPGYVSYELKGRGGLWTSTVAKHIVSSDKSILDVLTDVNAELVESYQAQTQTIQQPVLESRLNESVFLHRLSGMTLIFEYVKVHRTLYS